MMSKMSEPPKNGVRIVVFLTEVDFRNMYLFNGCHRLYSVTRNDKLWAYEITFQKQNSEHPLVPGDFEVRLFDAKQ